MDKSAALRILGLTEEKSAEEINAILMSKKADIEKKKSVAPTAVLKQKFDEILEKFDQAAEVLLAEVDSCIAEKHDQEEVGSLQNDIQPGQILSERYEIEALIGQGSMDAVYRAVDRDSGEKIAIKVLLPSLTQNAEALENFLKEAKVSAALTHPHIANVFDIQYQGSLHFLTMELLEGENLAQLMEKRHKVHHAFSENEMLDMMEQLVSALGYAHQYTIHREIKPENIWLDKNGNYKITDFGIIQLQSVSERMQNCSDIGTVYYMAPEQIKGAGNIDLRADIYALGVMLYHIATGDIPAGLIKPLQDKRPDLSAGFCAAVMQCMEPEPDDRPQTANELLELLQKKAAESSQQVMPEVAKIQSKGKGKLSIALGIAIIVVGIIGAVVMNGKDETAVEGIDQVGQQKIEATKLLGQIESLKKRLDNSVEKLDREVSEARRDNSLQLKTLEFWQKNGQQFIVNSATVTELEGEKAVGQGFLQDEKQLAKAIETLTSVKKGYENLFECFESLNGFEKQQQEYENLQEQWKKTGMGGLLVKEALATDESIQQAQQAGKGCLTLSLTAKAIQQYHQANKSIESLSLAESQTLKARQDWDIYRTRYNLDNPAAIGDAEMAMVQAEKQKSEGLVNEAITSFAAAQQAFSTAKKQVADKVAEKEIQLAEEEKLRAIEEAKVIEAAKIANAAKAAADAQAAKEREEQFRQGKTVAVPGSTIVLKGIPAGSFQMGSNHDDADERPAHKVNIKAFYMQETELTWEQYQPCVDAGVCTSDDDEGDGKGKRPVINVSWNDVQDYIKWLNKKTGQRFRLPSESEWEYAARAGTTGKYSWGDAISCSNAHYDGGKGSACHFAPNGDDSGSMEVKHYSPNAFGLYDVHGNVWEWVQDCWNETYAGAPANGEAWLAGNCEKRVLRGGSWGFGPADLRSSNRDIYTAAKRYYFFGFRLAQDV